MKNRIQSFRSDRVIQLLVWDLSTFEVVLNQNFEFKITELKAYIWDSK